MLTAVPGTVSSREARDRLRGHLITPGKPQMPQLCMEGATMGPRSHKLAGVSLWAWTPGWNMSSLPGSCGWEIIRTGQSHRENLHRTFSGSAPSPRRPPLLLRACTRSILKRVLNCKTVSPPTPEGEAGEPSPASRGHSTDGAGGGRGAASTSFLRELAVSVLGTRRR